MALPALSNGFFSLHSRTAFSVVPLFTTPPYACYALRRLQRAKRITMATIKAFIRKNDNLFIKVKSKFDGMTDCVETVNMGFAKVMTKNLHPQNHYEQRTLGIAGAWFVGSSRDYFEVYQDERFTGFKIFNCCGSFLLVTEKTV